MSNRLKYNNCDFGEGLKFHVLALLSADAINTAKHCRAACDWLIAARQRSNISKIMQIESAQRRFTKRVPGLKYVSYKDILERLGLETLEMRRRRQDL